MYKQKSYNVNYPRSSSTICNSEQTDQPEQSEQNILEILGDVIGALSLFGLLFVGLFFAGVYS
jgi:hypothetical protein